MIDPGYALSTLVEYSDRLEGKILHIGTMDECKSAADQLKVDWSDECDAGYLRYCLAVLFRSPGLRKVPVGDVWFSLKVSPEHLH